MADLDVKKLLAANGDLLAVLDAVPEGPERDRLARQVLGGIAGDALRERLRHERAARSWREPTENDHGTLADMLARPPVAEPYLVDQLQGRRHNVSLTGQYKVGKTMTACTYVKSLVDGEPFLGQETRLPQRQKVGWLNFEMDPDDLLAYLRPLGVENTGRVALLNLRGLRLPLLAEPAYEWLKRWLVEREVGALVVDSWRRMCSSSGVSENDNTEVEQLTERVDQLKRDAGVDAALFTVHTPRERAAEGEERARGATALDDWVDVRWVQTRQGRARFLHTQGRRVPERERSLVFDEATHLVSVGGPGGRREHRRERGIEHVVNTVLAAQVTNGGGGLSKNELKRRLRNAEDISHNDADLNQFIAEAEASGRVRVEAGPNRSHRYLPGAAQSGSNRPGETK